MKKINLALTLTIGLLSAAPVMAQDKSATCQIDQNGQTVCKSKCIFSPEAGGSFSIQHPQKNKYLFDGISMISVYIVEKDVAEVRGLTRDGINSRWGEAHRSKQQKACWVGSDFKVCAW